AAISASSAVCARSVAAWCLRCAAARRFSGFPRAISPPIGRGLVGGAGGDARAADRLVGMPDQVGLLEHGDDLLERALFGQALLEPHVRAGHLLAGPGAERGLALLDQLAELLELLLVFGQIAGVGGELVAGQARVA